jgi:hypothetical protein
MDSLRLSLDDKSNFLYNAAPNLSTLIWPRQKRATGLILARIIGPHVATGSNTSCALTSIKAMTTQYVMAAEDASGNITLTVPMDAK